MVSATDDDLASCTIGTFTHEILKPGYRQHISYDIQIPLVENCSPSDLLGHLVVQQNIPLFAQKEFEAALDAFIWEETRKFTAELVDKRMQQKLAECGNDHTKLTIVSGIRDESPAIFQQYIDDKSKQDPAFEEQFQWVMRHCNSAQLTHLIEEEAAMTTEMRSLIRARDAELGRLEKACEDSLAASSKSMAKFDQHSHEISMLNAEIRQASVDYSRQIEALLERQRRDYRLLVQRLYHNEDIGDKTAAIGGKTLSLANRKFASSLSASTSFGSFREKKGVACGNKTNKFKKSISCDEKMATQVASNGNKHTSTTNYSESFSIYIGSQLKTMHNARILTCSRLSDLCISQQQTSSDGEEEESMDGSKRLHLLMSLYGRELSALVLIVGRDPLWHVHRRTRFARLCEQSAELQFQSLETQLRAIEEQVRKANQSRRHRRQFMDLSQLSYSPPLEFYDSSDDEGQLQTGDVYVTRHSNLSAVQLVFHLVGDSALAEQEVTSRHPCIGGLRNIVRLSAHSAIRNISLPLLMVDELKEELSANTGWCLARSELVYKCLKGFLMEVCANGGSNTSMAGTSAGPNQSLHFNINFALPSIVAPLLFQQLVELFASIYYLVPSLNA